MPRSLGLTFLLRPTVMVSPSALDSNTFPLLNPSVIVKRREGGALTSCFAMLFTEGAG